MREEQGPIRKAQEGDRKSKQTTSPEATEVGTVTLFITGSLKCREHIHAHFRSILLKPRHPRTLTDAFPKRASRGPIHGQVNDTRKRACTHPRTIRTMEQVSDCPSEFDLVSRVDPDLERGPPFKRDLTFRAHSVEN
ncbi:hypothetical protein CRG98_002656 [Punica granatum]|uniref:Uncharacterized protein n=1 Tax=Punica granatum TaxID=22663 RepID=A0A2I0L9X3_PUNGR|nr:hypothetical protein CRG98_002656 [Punica granatum]